VHRAAPTDDDWEEQLLRVLNHQEEPFGDTSIFAHFHLMSAARAAGVPVVLSGQGGDELLLGYPSLVNAYLGHLISRGRVLEAGREWRAWTRRTGRTHVLQAALLHSLPLGVRDRVRSTQVMRLADIVSPRLRRQVSLRRFEENGREALDSYVSQVFTRFSIPHLVHYDDRNGMAFAVEGRMPFLDHRLVDLMFSVEYEALFRLGTTKRVLRESFADLLPPTVRDRADKVGFHTPLAAWLRRALPWIEQTMTRDRIEHVGVLNGVRYARRLEELRHGSDDAALEVWRGFIYHLWVDRFDVQVEKTSEREEVAQVLSLAR
jgi:asparagine synthase (glutamine-hydrolysing)